MKIVKINKTIPIAILCMLVLLSSPAFAQKNQFGSNAPVDIKADVMTITGGGKKIVFSKNVKLIKDDITILSDRIEVETDDNKEFKNIVATGNVKIIQDGNNITAGKAVYLKESNRIILTQSPQIWNSDYNVVGDKITILVDEKKSIVENSRLVANPTNNK